MTKTRPERARHPSIPLTIAFHTNVDDVLRDCARLLGWRTERLREATKTAIRSRHHEAILARESHRANGRQPDIYQLSIGTGYVYYTVEPQMVVVCGYGWDIPGEPLDDLDGGGFVTEYAWSLPPEVD